jgi:hypothetical protein
MPPRTRLNRRDLVIYSATVNAQIYAERLHASPADETFDELMKELKKIEKEITDSERTTQEVVPVWPYVRNPGV